MCTSICLLTVLLSALSFAAGDWEVWKDCELVEDEYMDGDSFYISRGPRSEYIIRLYFVDCPESDSRFSERVREQAEYFGIDSEDCLEVGKEAAEFTHELLEDGFTVHTRKVKSFSASKKPRYYGFIEYADGKFLGEELVRRGFARIYGKPVDRPDGKGEASIYARLGALKSEAKSRKAGAWKYNDNIDRSAKVKLREPQIESGRKLVIDRTVSIYSAEPPYKFRGLLRSGAELTLLELRENQYVIVSFAANGKTLKGACLKRDLGL